MQSISRISILAGLYALSTPLLLNAQATGTISGTVTDPSGLAVASATIVATNVGTNLKRTVTADGIGQYAIPLLPAGSYEVRIESSGLAPFSQTNIVLQADTTVQVNAKLALQGTEQKVIVSDTPDMVQATSTNLVQVVEQRRVADLPLNGRNILQLMTLNAGVSDKNSSGGTLQVNTFAFGNYSSPVSINGARGNGTNFVLDNASNNDLYTNIAAPFPNPDAIQEVSVQTSTFDAQYGRGVGGVVNAVTRSGSNELHGSTYDYLRNYNLNGSNYFSGRDTLKRNQFGANVGGPVVIPKLYDGHNRTFFFFSYQGTRSGTATPGSLVIAPSAAMKGGDFSAWLAPDGTGAIHDPLAPNTYFPGNIIPASRFDPVAQKILQYLPTSSSPDYRLRFGTPTQTQTDDQYVIRGDHSFNDRHRLSLRYFLMHFDQPWVTIPNNLSYVATGQFGYAHNAVVNHTWIVTPSFVNQLTLSFSRETPQAVPPADIQNTNLQAFGANVVTAPNYPTMNLAISNWSGINLGLGYYSPESTYQITDSLSYSNGRHSLRFGGEFVRYRIDVASYYLSGGSASFSGQLLSDPRRSNAGNAFAEFMLGDAASWQQQSFWSERLYNQYPALYIQDDFRVTPRLTLNLGLRWDPKFDYKEARNKEMTFIAGQQSTVYPNAPLGLQFIGDKGIGSTIQPSDLNNFAPRLGLAYQLRSRTVVRAGYGIFYDQNPAIANNRAAAGQPFVQQTVLVGPVPLSNPYGSAPPLNPYPVNPSPDVKFTPYSTWALRSTNAVSGYLQNWNFVLEHQIGGHVLLRGAYVGSKGTKLLNAMEINPGIYTPSATPANLNSRRPYLNIGGLQLGMSNGNSTYQALQLTLQNRFSHGFSILANYTYSKSSDYSSYGSVEGNQAGPNPFNLRDNRAVSDFDITHKLIVSGVIEHPKFSDSNMFVRSVLGGWQSNFILTAESGTPFTILSGVDNALSGVGGEFADYSGAPWALPGDRSKSQKIIEWFNTASFGTNAIGTIGSGRRNQLRGPNLVNVDYSLFKDFSVREHAHVQLRGEFFNIFNHTQLTNPNGTVTSPVFGEITSARSPRIVQLALRLSF
jgi:outer membrane receptor protein involved in Fe transport